MEYPFYLSGLIFLGLFLVFFGLAYGGYRFFLFSLKRLFKGVNFSFFIRCPLLLIFFEIAALLYLNILDLKRIAFVQQSLVVLVIATLGWIFSAILNLFYHYILGKNHTENLNEISKRSFLTQIHFFYRAATFLIICFTVAAILMSFPQIKSLGIGILGSAGVAGIALGIAARPILLNLMAGLQIAITKAIKLGDALFIEDDFCRVESIHLTHVIVRTWDLRRRIFPISYFIDRPFQNWSCHSTRILGVVYLYTDYRLPVEVIREELHKILQTSPLWDGKTWKVQVTEFKEQTMQIRLTMSAVDAPTAFNLRCYVREKLISFLQQQYPQVLPTLRIEIEKKNIDLKR